jgi:hypothetical protein
MFDDKKFSCDLEYFIRMYGYSKLSDSELIDKISILRNEELKLKWIKEIIIKKNSLIIEEKYDLGLDWYIKEHKYQYKTEKELAEIIMNEKFNSTLKRVWLKQIGKEYFDKFVKEQKLDEPHMEFTKKCKQCGKLIPNNIVFCSKECMINKKYSKVIVNDSIIKESFMEYVKENPNETEKQLMKVKNKNVC